MYVHSTRGISVDESPYVLLRGWAFHRLMPEILGKPDWLDLRKLRPKTFESLMYNTALQVECDITPQFVAENPAAIAWIAKAYRVLFKCLQHDWGMTNILMVEADLPVISLPDGREICCGMPDIFGISEAYEGAITVELKSGFQRVKKCGAKLARYNSGAKLLTDDLQLGVPYKGAIWVTFASTKLDRRSGHYKWATRPVVTPEFVPYDIDGINSVMLRKYDVDLDVLAGLPRRYNYGGSTNVTASAA